MNPPTSFAGITHLLLSAAMSLAVSPLGAIRAMSEAAADALDTGRDDKTHHEANNATQTCAHVYDLSAYRRRASGPGRGVA